MRMKCQLECTICPASPNSVFASLSERELHELKFLRTTNAYKKKQVIFYEGNPALGVYCVSEGRVKLYKTSDGGKQRILGLREKGALLGCASLFSGQVEQYTAEAIEDTKICFLEKNGFLTFLKLHPEATMALLVRISQEAIKSHDQLMDQTFKSVRRRLAELLLTLETSFGVKQDKGVVLLNLNLSREELSQAIGATMETTVRLLSECKKEGLIAERGRQLVILEPAKLQLLASQAF